VNIGRSFTFFLDDPEWIKKLLLGALISLIPFVGGFIILGWALAVTRNVYNGVDNVIPDWSDLGGYLVRGLVAWIGAIIWASPVLLLFICLGVGIVATSSSDVAAAVLVLSGFGLALIAIVYMAIFLPVPIARYAIKGDFGAMFEFSEILAEVRRGIQPLLIAMIIWLIASMIVAPIGLLACFVGVYVTSALSYLMIGHAMGQAYREIDRPGPLQAPPAF
jgi:hypothetical protein